MSATPPDRYGPYEIVARLSAGGMGEVYRARDTRLHRDVALKLLPQAFATDADRRRRFFQEAQAAGALNHPNILSIHDANLEGDTPYLVTELVEGTTLRQEMEQGALAVRRVLDLGAQIASGLQAAHAAGIVHRDLKPENLMLTRDGRVKILDFGLAKTLDLVGTTSAATQTQTETGIVLGTVPYMSPQQARGEAVDFRSDQFSLGLVLYEMLTGTHPFRRDSSVQTMSAIIADEPKALSGVNRKVPLPLRWIVERCLAKDPAARYASTTDLARDLSTLQVRFAEVSEEVIGQPRPSLRSQVARAVAAAAVACSLALAAWALTRPAGNPLDSYRFTPLVTDAPFQTSPAWSPDGRSLAYVSQVDGVLQVFTRSLTSPLRAQLTRSLFDCTDPFWSPDGSRVFYHAQAADRQGLWSVSIAGGDPELVLPNAFRTAMAPDGRGMAFLRQSEQDLYSYELMAAPAFDQPARAIDLGAKSKLSDAWLRFSSDGRRLLVWFTRSFADEQLWLQGTESPFRLVSWPDGSVRTALTSIYAHTDRATVGAFSWLPDNRRIVVSVGDERSAARRLWMADLETDRVEPLTTTPAAEGLPSVSSDGSRLAFTSEAVDFDLVALPLDGRAPRPVLATSRNEFDPTWAPDQSQFAFVTDRGGTIELWLRSADGRFERPLVTEADFPSSTRAMGSTAFSPDGSRVAFQRLGRSGGYRIYIATTAGATPPVEFGSQASFHDSPSWSPDGAWIAMVYGAPGGESHLVKARVNGTGEPVTLSRSVLAFSRAEWSPDGRQIVFLSNQGLAVIPADAGQARVLSDEPWFAYTWSADSRLVYGLREGLQDRHFMLAAVDVASGQERVINPDLGVIPPANQPIRGLTRLGTDAVVTSIARARSEIWMLEGFGGPRSGMGRMWEALWGR